LSLFCAVAYSGVGNRVMTSTNGIAWFIGVSAGDFTWVSVTWSEETAQFCAVALTGAGWGIMTSPNATSWTLRPCLLGTTNSWRAVCYSPGLGIFCAVAETGNGNQVMVS
jgi:hypothetical protein